MFLNLNRTDSELYEDYADYADYVSDRHIRVAVGFLKLHDTGIPFPQRIYVSLRDFVDYWSQPCNIFQSCDLLFPIDSIQDCLAKMAFGLVEHPKNKYILVPRVVVEAGFDFDHDPEVIGKLTNEIGEMNRANRKAYKDIKNFTQRLHVNFG